MEYKIRQMKNTEYPLLNDFLYEAIYVVIPHFIYIQIMLYSVELKAA